MHVNFSPLGSQPGGGSGGGGSGSRAPLAEAVAPAHSSAKGSSLAALGAMRLQPFVIPDEDAGALGGFAPRGGGGGGGSLQQQQQQEQEQRKQLRQQLLPGGVPVVRALRPKEPSMRILEVQGSFREEWHRPSSVKRADSAAPPEGSDIHTVKLNWSKVQLYLAKNRMSTRDSFREIDSTHTGLISETEYSDWLKNQVEIASPRGEVERHTLWAYLVAAADPAKPPSEEEHIGLSVVTFDNNGRTAAHNTILTAEAYCLAVSRRRLGSAV